MAGSSPAKGVGVIQPQRTRRPLPRLWYLEAGVAFDVFDDRGQVFLGGALVDRVLEDEPRRLADPHRHAELLALCDGEIDVLREYLDSCAKVAEPSDSVSRYTVTACGSLRNGGFLAHRGR